MRRDPRKYLWDAREAARTVLTFVQGRAWEEYRQDVLLRSAVERQLEIVGEALNQLSKRDAELARLIPELGSVVAFRNILVHGYADVDDAAVWRIVSEDLPELESRLDALLDTEKPPGS